jgi:hypothetical protein
MYVEKFSAANAISPHDPADGYLFIFGLCFVLAIIIIAAFIEG